MPKMESQLGLICGATYTISLIICESSFENIDGIFG